MHLRWPYGKHQAWQQGHRLKSCHVVSTVRVEESPCPCLLGTTLALPVLRRPHDFTKMFKPKKPDRGSWPHPHAHPSWRNPGMAFRVWDDLGMQEAIVSSWPLPPTGPGLICSFPRNWGPSPASEPVQAEGGASWQDHPHALLTTFHQNLTCLQGRRWHFLRLPILAPSLTTSLSYVN